MKSWLVGCTVAAIIGVGFFLAPKKQAAPLPVVDPPPASKPVAAAPPSPVPPAVVLDRVVETADIDSLLDPPAIPRAEARTSHEPMLIQVGYDEPVSPALPPAMVPAIPPARESDAPDACSEDMQPEECDVPLAVAFYSPDSGRTWETELQPEPAAGLLDSNGVQPLSCLWRQDVELLEAMPRALPIALFEREAADAQKVIVRRVYDTFHTANQRPAGRIEWYTRWYGDAAFPRQMGSLLVPKCLTDLPRETNLLQQRYRTSTGLENIF